VVESFAILGGGQTPYGTWITCEEVVNRGATGTPHGYIFEIDASASGPVQARHRGRALRARGCGLAGWHPLRDRGSQERLLLLPLHPRKSAGERWQPGRHQRRAAGAQDKGVQNAIMDTFPTVGEPYEVEWVTIAEPNPADDTDSSPLAVGEQAKGAAIFDREEGIWVGGDKVYFDCTEGGVANLRAGLRVRPWQSDHNAHLPVRQREDAGESGQRRDRAQDRRHLPARG
jgi:uncharacterized protein